MLSIGGRVSRDDMEIFPENYPEIKTKLVAYLISQRPFVHIINIHFC